MGESSPDGRERHGRASAEHCPTGADRACGNLRRPLAPVFLDAVHRAEESLERLSRGLKGDTCGSGHSSQLDSIANKITLCDALIRESSDTPHNIIGVTQALASGLQDEDIRPAAVEVAAERLPKADAQSFVQLATLIKCACSNEDWERVCTLTVVPRLRKLNLSALSDYSALLDVSTMGRSSAAALLIHGDTLLRWCAEARPGDAQTLGRVLALAEAAVPAGVLNASLRSAAARTSVEDVVSLRAALGRASLAVLLDAAAPRLASLLACALCPDLAVDAHRLDAIAALREATSLSYASDVLSSALGGMGRRLLDALRRSVPPQRVANAYAQIRAAVPHDVWSAPAVRCARHSLLSGLRDAISDSMVK